MTRTEIRKSFIIRMRGDEAVRILMVEDEAPIREGVCDYLSECNYEMIAASDGQEAMDLFDSNEVHLVLLDIQLPKKNGLEVLEYIRRKSSIPALMLTAFSDEEYQLKAFSQLADGYIEKPFSLPVLKARIDALMKRYYPDTEVFTYQNTSVNFSSYTATLSGEKVDMNAKEIEILKCLVDHEGQALSRQQIIDQVWKETDEIPFDRVIDVYMKELRKKLALDCIITIRNVGYKLERL